MQIDSLTVLEAKKLESEMQAGPWSLKALGESSLAPSSWLCLPALLGCGPITPVSASVSTWLSCSCVVVLSPLSLVSTLVPGFSTTCLNQDDSPSRSLHRQRPCSQITSRAQAPGLGSEHIFLGVTIQGTTWGFLGDTTPHPHISSPGLVPTQPSPMGPGETWGSSPLFDCGWLRGPLLAFVPSAHEAGSLPTSPSSVVPALLVPFPGVFDSGRPPSPLERFIHPFHQPPMSLSW